MTDELAKAISAIAAEDRSAFIQSIRDIGGVDPAAWRHRAESMNRRCGGAYSGDQLARVHEALCGYFEEPRDSTAFYDTRWLYERPVTAAEIRQRPFLNLGYVGTGDAIQLETRDEPFRPNIQLYTHLLDREDVTGRDVVEVGSGRGGGASFLSRYHRPRSVIGIDGSRTQVAACSALIDDVEFRHGHACDLPLEAGCADLVINVESSHCYVPLERFFAEVHRVLRDGGRFLLTDIIYAKSRVFEYLTGLERRFHVLQKADITPNVIASLETYGPEQLLRALDSRTGADRRQALPMLSRIYMPIEQAPFSNYGALTSGQALYLSFLCEKRDP